MHEVFYVLWICVFMSFFTVGIFLSIIFWNIFLPHCFFGSSATQVNIYIRPYGPKVHDDSSFKKIFYLCFLDWIICIGLSCILMTFPSVIFNNLKAQLINIFISNILVLDYKIFILLLFWFPYFSQKISCLFIHYEHIFLYSLEQSYNCFKIFLFTEIRLVVA